jgi:hypothetical protein
VWTTGCDSWYLDERGRNTTLWPGFSWKFRRETERFDPAAYRFAEAPAMAPVPVGRRPTIHLASASNPRQMRVRGRGTSTITVVQAQAIGGRRP